MYRALVDFKDLRDGGYEYKAGDTYPRNGKVDVERAKMLATPNIHRGALIEEVSEKVKAEKVEKAEKAEKTEKSAKKD